MTLPLAYESPPLQRRALWPAYVAESLSSVGSTLLMVGIFFYTEHRLGWRVRDNFLLACGQGAVYVAGSLLAPLIARRLGRRRGLIAIFIALTFIPVFAVAAPTSSALVAALLIYTLVSSMNWPVLESLVCSGADAHALSRRVGTYNLVWSATNTIIFAVSGTIIQYWPEGMFAVPAVVHAISAVLMWVNRDIDQEAETTAHVEPEPQLLAQRTLAMWLARISLPATYVVVYSLMAMMPSLPVMQSLTPAVATLVGSTWMLSRFIMFIMLGATTWWHTRPMLLLASAAVMLVAFIGVTIRPSDFTAASSFVIDIASMITWQIVLGAVMGLIYSGSLYFGMVLSKGSTEHGGYHEALIGLGSILGPGVAALAQWKWPNNVGAGVSAVSCVIAATVAAAAIAALRASKQRPTN